MSPVVHEKTNLQKRSKRNEPVLPSTVVICGEDGQELVGVCGGPDEQGRCPWVDVEGRLPCDGSWIVSRGWTLRVAAEATGCPVAMLGMSTADAA
jgi:hypothetical protein